MLFVKSFVLLFVSCLECVMSKMENQDITCQFRFKDCDGNLKPIEGSLKEMLDTLLLKTNEASFICTSCKDVLHRCFEFKSKCLSMQTNIVGNINIGNTKESPTGVANPEDLKTCTLCLAVLKSYNFMALDSADDDMLKQVFERCIPELDLSFTMKPTICKPCYEHLRIYFNVMRSCSILEETAMVDEGLMSSQDIGKLTLPRDLCEKNDNNVGIIKIEGTFREEKENRFDYMEMEDTKSIDVLKVTESVLTGNDGIKVDGIKTEVTLEDEEDNEVVTTPLDMLNCTSREIYEANEIKTEDMACEENETGFDQKNYTEMEDTKSPDLIQFASANMICNGGSAADTIKTEVIFCEKLKIEEFKSEFCFVDHKLNNLQQLNLKQALKCEEEDNENFTETNSEKLLPYHNEKIEIVPMDEQNFDRKKSPSNQAKFKSNLKEHLPGHRSPLEKAAYKCDSCSHQTKYKTALKAHLLQHKDPSEITMYKCESCSFQTKYKTSLKIHLLKHKKDSLEVTKFKCDSCPYQTRYKTALKSHLLQHKDPSEITMYKCELCSLQTKYKRHLKKHLLTHKDHSEITMHNCDYCSYETKYKSELNKHLLKHKDPSEVTVYKCDHCAYQSKYKEYFKKHLLKHKDLSEVTMYKCQSCSYQTKYKRNLKQHLLRHKDPTEVTMYKCDSCSYHTKYKTNMKIHSLKHWKDSLQT